MRPLKTEMCVASIVTAPSDGGEIAQLEVLRLLAQQPQLSQRELSRSLGLSLGKTRYLLHALLDKGQIKVRNFKRSDRKMAYSYLLTPAGLREKLRLTSSFLKRKEAAFEQLKATIAAQRTEVEQQDFAR